jgi:hypothetical protein
LANSSAEKAISGEMGSLRGSIGTAPFVK